jgi:hypothetical protein
MRYEYAETIGLRQEHCGIAPIFGAVWVGLAITHRIGFANNAKLLCDQSGFSLAGDIDSLSPRR